MKSSVYSVRQLYVLSSLTSKGSCVISKGVVTQGRLNLNLGDASVRDLPIDKKWWILCNEMQLNKSTAPASSVSGSRSGQHVTEYHHDVDKSSAPHYIGLLQKYDRKGVPLKVLSDLAVRLRTMPLRFGLKRDIILTEATKSLTEMLAGCENSSMDRECYCCRKN